MRRLFALMLGLTLSIGSIAEASPGLEPEDARLELHLESRPTPPYPGEMILLSIQGTFRIPVVREKLIQPALGGFDWMQLGEDRWYKQMEDGFEVLKFERRMALFPQEPGEIEITQFTHRLDLLDRRGRGITTELVSNTAVLTTLPGPETQTWWFPVRKLDVDDRWSNQPEALDPGSAALRIVSLTIEGSPPQRIPPMPELTGAGAHIFPHPEHRIVSLGPEGPVTRVFWRWTIRPQLGAAGYTDPIRLDYFDAEARETKSITLSAQRVAYLGGPSEIARDPSRPESTEALEAREVSVRPALPGGILPLLLAAGLLAGLLCVIGQGRWAWPRRLIAELDLLALQRAAWRGDSGGVRQRAHKALAAQGAEIPEALRDLDRAIYGPGAAKPDLPRVARSVRRAVRRVRVGGLVGP